MFLPLFWSHPCFTIYAGNLMRWWSSSETGVGTTSMGVASLTSMALNLDSTELDRTLLPTTSSESGESVPMVNILAQRLSPVSVTSYGSYYVQSILSRSVVYCHYLFAVEIYCYCWSVVCCYYSSVVWCCCYFFLFRNCHSISLHLLQWSNAQHTSLVASPGNSAHCK